MISLLSVWAVEMGYKKSLKPQRSKFYGFFYKFILNPYFRLSQSRKLLPFSLTSCVYSCLHMTINGLAGGRVYHVRDILRK